MSEKTILEVFDKHFSHIKYDKKLNKEFYRFHITYLNNNKQHLEFFASNLLGVHTIRFKDSDKIKFFNDILDVDLDKLTKELLSLDSVNEEFKISSDTFNLTCMYLIHKFKTSPDLKEDERKDAMYNVGLIFFYRCMAAITSSYFKYAADPRIVELAYANLSQKFLIKKLGSWYKVLDYRTKELVDNTGLHVSTFNNFNVDDDIIYLINDSQGRIRDIVKNYYKEFHAVHVSGASLTKVDSMGVNLEGEVMLKDKISNIESVINNILGILHDNDTFIKDDLIEVLCGINSNSSFKSIKLTLNWLSDSYMDPTLHKDIDKFVTSVLLFSYDVLNNSLDGLNKKDYAAILVNLKNVYNSSRSKDEDLDNIKSLGEKILRKSFPKSVSESLILSTRTAVVLYITLRALVSNKY